MKSNILEFFAGGNTSQGFYSLYRYVLSQEEARRIICLKGGPGTGKSSLMKGVASHFHEKGYEIELHHCSSDPNSLDGLVIQGLNVALLDGTAPHMTDPINPGAVDEILNLGQCWNEKEIRKNRNKIIETNKEIGRTFQRAYRYLGAAGLVHDDWSTMNKTAQSQSKLNELKVKLKKEMKDRIKDKTQDIMRKGKKVLQTNCFTEQVDVISVPGKSRHLFASAFTPKGVVSFIDTILFEDYEIINLIGGPGTGKTEVMTNLMEEALLEGIDVEVFHDPLIPQRIEHIIFPSLKLAVLTSNEITQKQFNGTHINMEALLEKKIQIKNQTEIDICKQLFYELLDCAFNILKCAKQLHDQLETYYIPNMDFTKLDAMKEEIIQKLENDEKELFKEVTK